MSGAELPDAVRRLLAERVHAFEHLETLLYLYGRPAEAYAPAALAAALRIPEDAAAEALDHLVEMGLAARSDEGRAGRYAPQTAEVAAAVAALAAACRDRRLAVMKLMSANAIERMRSNAARTFVDAFLIGRRKNDG
jgi:DNA-binding MarR family transcriptional regulator